MKTAWRTERPTTVAPWPRISVVGRAPRRCAKSRPIAMSLTKSVVSPNLSRESQTGTSWPKLAHICNSGLSFLPVTPNGITLGEWLCTTACTSGRAS